MPCPSGPVVVSTPEVRWYSGWPAAVGVQLAERLDVVHAHRGLAQDLVLGVYGLHPRQVEQRVEEHRRVAGREHEAVAVRPDRIGGVEPQKALPQRVGDGGHRHRRAGMARVGLLDGVDRQRPDRVDAERVDVRCDRLGDGGHRCPILVQPVLSQLNDTRTRRGHRLDSTSVPDESPIDTEKRVAAEAAAELVEDGMKVGLGTGSTVAFLLPGARRAPALDPLRRHLAGDRAARSGARHRRRVVRRRGSPRHRDRRRPTRSRRTAG